MRIRLTRLDPRRVALFVVVATIAAVVVIVGREAGWGGLAARGQSGPPMTLTLNAPDTCETTSGRGYAGSELRTDADGNTTEDSVFAGWFGIAEVDVKWSVSGGTPPYTLEIDGETRDATHEYTGATGTASVSCALKTGETFIDPYGGKRRYNDNPPKVDSGLKTIRATVKDSAGVKVEATVGVYAILVVKSGFVKLREGQTYRVHGFLMTMPKDVEMETGEVEEWSCEGDDCESGAFQLFTVGDGYEAAVWLGLDSGKDHGRTIRIDDRLRGADQTTHPIEEKLDQLVESIGRLPQFDGS